MYYTIIMYDYMLHLKNVLILIIFGKKRYNNIVAKHVQYTSPLNKRAVQMPLV